MVNYAGTAHQHDLLDAMLMQSDVYVLDTHTSRFRGARIFEIHHTGVVLCVTDGRTVPCTPQEVYLNIPPRR